MKSILVILTLCFVSQVSGQVKIGENPQNIDASSVLELESNSQVLVITRVTTAQMNAITPLRGALVFNNDENCVFYYDGAEWVNLCLQGAAEVQTFSADPVVNSEATIVITQTGDNYNFEVSEITGEVIADGSINGFLDIQFNSITADQLAPNSVGQEELQDNTVGDLEIDYGQVTLSDFDNDPNFITSAQLISGDTPNAITAGSDGGALYDDTALQAQVDDIALDITQHLMDDGDLSDQNEIQDASEVEVTPNGNLASDNVQNALEELQGDVDLLVAGGGADGVVTNITTTGNDLVVTGANGGFNGNVNLEPLVDNAVSNNGFLTAEVDGSITNEAITNIELNGNTLEIIEGGTLITGDLSGLAGAGADGVVTNVELNGTDLEFTGLNGGFNGTIPLAGLGGGGADGVISNVDFDGANLNFTGANGGFAGPVNISGVNTDNQNAIDVPFTPAGNTVSNNVQDAIEELQTEIDGISGGGAANPNDELIDVFNLTGTVINIAEGANVPAPIDLDPTFVTETELAAFNVDDADAIPTNELQDLQFDAGTNILTVTNPSTPGNEVDLTQYLDNQNADEVPVAATPTNYTAATPDVEAHLAGIDAAIAAGGGNPNDELITNFAVNGANLEITEAGVTFPVALTDISTDDQNADEVPVAATPTNYTAATPDVEAHLAGIDAAIAAGGGNPNDELITNFAVNGANLEITEAGVTFPVALADISTDDQNADEVPVAATPTNYTAATPDVEAHLAGIDAAIAAGGGNPNDELITNFAVNGANLEITEAGVTFPVALADISTDDQNADEVPVAATPTNYTAATPDVEAHLAGIDAAIAASGGNPNDELITNFAVNGANLEITEAGVTFPVALADISTDDQNADEVPVAATPTNYTAATPDVEAHLAGIDAAIAASGGNPNDELITNFAVNGANLEITEAGVTFPVALADISTDDQNADEVPVAATPTNYTAATPDVEAHLAGIDAVIGGAAGINTGLQYSIPFYNAAGNNFDQGIFNGGQSFLWDQSARLGSGALRLGLDGQPADSESKVQITENVNGVAYPLVLNNRNDNLGSATALVFTTDSRPDGNRKAALVYERTQNNGVGDFHFVQNQNNASFGTFNLNTDKSLTITNDKNIVLYGGIDIDGIGTGANDEVLASDGAGGLKWIAGGGGGATIVSDDTGNSISASVNDGGAFYDDSAISAAIAANATAITTKEDSANKSTDVTLADATNTLFPTELAVKTYVDNEIGAVANTNFAENDLTLNGNRTHDLSGNDFVLGGTGNVAIGTPPGALTNKLTITGSTRTSGLLNSAGSAGVPSYRFTDNGDTGMYLVDNAGALGLTANNTQAIIIDSNQDVGIGPSFDNTNISARLHVDGDVRVEGEITASGTITELVPDYVFQNYFDGFSSLNENYGFNSLSEVEYFIKKNKHLPGVTSASQAQKQGFWNLSQSNLKNLEKIEELFLHTIEQEKKIETLKAENETLSNELEVLKKDMAEIKALLQSNAKGN